MLLLPEAAGPQHPVLRTVPREPGSVRRSTSIDTLRPDGLLGDPVVEARARDLWTAPDGGAGAQREVAVHAVIGRASGRLERISADPSDPGQMVRTGTDPADTADPSDPSDPSGAGSLETLEGAVVGPGFRRRVAEIFPEGSLLFSLLDDLPGAVLVSGYALLEGGALGDEPAYGAPEDLCAGWARGSAMQEALRTRGQLPVPTGPPSPSPLEEAAGDPLAYHQMASLGPYGMRRRRRLDVGTGDPCRVDAHFRDVHVGATGHATVLHEYSVTAMVDRSSGQMLDVAAEAEVLPWQECPGAVASARRVVGQPVGGLRRWVRGELSGARTCTHLNDTLRALADVAAFL